MASRLVLVALAWMLATFPLVVRNSDAAIVQWQVADGGNGHYYELVGNYLDPDQRWSWQDSKVMAESLAHLGMFGHLATIASQAENDFLVNTFHLDNPWPTWIGFTDNEEFGGYESFGQPTPQVDGWVWVTGEPITFTDWVLGSPENTNDEDFALIGSQHADHHHWNDDRGGERAHAPFFVEFEPAAVPEPSSAILLAGLFVICAVGRQFRRRQN